MLLFICILLYFNLKDKADIILSIYYYQQTPKLT